MAHASLVGLLLWVAEAPSLPLALHWRDHGLDWLGLAFIGSDWLNRSWPNLVGPMSFRLGPEPQT